MPKDDACEYTDGQSRTQELQAAVLRLQERINELENPGSVTTSITLIDPHASASSACAAGSSRVANLTETMSPSGDDNGQIFLFLINPLLMVESSV